MKHDTWQDDEANAIRVAKEQLRVDFPDYGGMLFCRTYTYDSENTSFYISLRIYRDRHSGERIDCFYEVSNVKGSLSARLLDTLPSWHTTQQDQRRHHT